MSPSPFRVNKSELVSRQIAGETLIVPIRGTVGDLNSIYTLNEPGTMIWSLLCAGTSAEHILGAVCREYEVSEEEAREDIRKFLESLQEADLISASADSGGKPCNS